MSTSPNRVYYDCKLLIANHRPDLPVMPMLSDISTIAAPGWQWCTWQTARILFFLPQQVPQPVRALQQIWTRSGGSDAHGELGRIAVPAVWWLKITLIAPGDVTPQEQSCIPLHPSRCISLPDFKSKRKLFIGPYLHWGIECNWNINI